MAQKPPFRKRAQGVVLALLPQTLGRQFMTVASLLVLLIVGGGSMALQALHATSESAQQLARERLTLMTDAQELVQHALLIERESFRIVASVSPEQMRSSYGDALSLLEETDRLISRLAAASDSAAILSLHQSGQLLRNTLHLLASLHDSIPEDAAQMRAHPGLQQFHAELQRHTLEMLSAAQELSAYLSDDYRQNIRQLADSTRQKQERVALLLGGSLFLVWLIAYPLFGRHVVNRLRLVSRYLRHDMSVDAQTLPVHGSDEIAQMARSVEQFLADRRQLAATNLILEAERKRQEELIEKLALTQNQLLQSEKLAAIGQLAAGVAHEINTPIGFVHSNLGTLQQYLRDIFRLVAAYEAEEDKLPDSIRESLAALRQQIDLVYLRQDGKELLEESLSGLQRVRRIVQDLKDFSHVDESERQLTNLEQCLDSTLNILASELRDRAEVVREFSGLPEIECAPSQINQVFMNLLLNALQALGEHGSITVRTGSDDNEVWAEIEDTGSGIRPEHLGRIFEPFFTTKPVGKGTGLGLSLSYGIIHKHGGRITVDSQPGRGSSFRVSLPRRQQG